MRRPRGPGGRFLTAEEIAAQKAAQAASGQGEDGGDGEGHDMGSDNEDVKKPGPSSSFQAGLGPLQYFYYKSNTLVAHS